MSDTHHVTGGETACECPGCGETLYIHSRMADVGDCVICDFCEKTYRIRYMDISVNYGLDEE